VVDVNRDSKDDKFSIGVGTCDLSAAQYSSIIYFSQLQKFSTALSIVHDAPQRLYEYPDLPVPK